MSKRIECEVIGFDCDQKGPAYNKCGNCPHASGYTNDQLRSYGVGNERINIQSQWSGSQLRGDGTATPVNQKQTTYTIIIKNGKIKESSF